jgi:hypothetical protein
MINRNIQEYDISKANISILLDMGYLKKTEYESLYNLPKHEREVKVGLMMRSDINAVKILNRGFIKARELFFEANGINDMNVLYIDKDSITLIDTIVKSIQVSDHIVFTPKSTYASMYKLGQVHFLYFNDGRNESYRFKYINQDMLEQFHHNYFIDFLLFIAEEAQVKSPLECIHIIRNFYNQYVGKTLDVLYYREFNPICKYKILKNLEVNLFCAVQYGNHMYL